MDNVSHSLLGLAVGELVQRSLAPENDGLAQRTRRRLLLFACWAASNFPDLDLVFTGMLPKPLGYLLHHRGHTHTLLYALPQALLLLAFIWLCWPAARALLRTSAPARKGLASVIAAGFALHLGLDYLNSYGIHPFYPFQPRWLFGDMVFIMEPVFWVAFGAPLAWMLGARRYRWMLALFMAAILVFFTFSGFLAWGALGALLAGGAALAAWQRRAGAHGRQALLAALVVGVGFVAVQGALSSHGKRIVGAQLAAFDPRGTLLDVAMTAFPANPVCWNYVSVERLTASDSYRLRRGTINLAPDLLAGGACPAALAAVAWTSEASLATLRARRRESCYFDAWLRFARAPLLGFNNAIDARFGTDANGNLATINYARFAGQPCDAVPAWGYPRADLLD